MFKTLIRFWLVHCIMLPCCTLTLRAVPPPSDFQTELSNYSCIIVSGHNVLVGDQKERAAEKDSKLGSVNKVLKAGYRASREFSILLKLTMILGFCSL